MAGKTVISRTTQFAQGSDLVNYRDWRHIADLLNDNDTRVTDSTTTQNHAITQVALRSASGMIETAIYRGGRYASADIDNILLSTGLVKDFLVKLTCDIAFWILITRRKPDANPQSVSGVPDALAKVMQLELGEAVFPFQEVVDASVDDFVTLDPNQDKNSVNTTPISTQADRMFGARSRRFPPITN